MTREHEFGFIQNRRGKWSQPGVPHRGWRCIEIEDAGAADRICEMCESQQIRYVQYMQHDTFPVVLGCGCVCAGHMEDDVRRAREREGFMVTRASKRRRWLTRRWRVSKKGNDWIEADGFRVTIFFRQGRWNASITDLSTDFTAFSRRYYESADEAKLAAFDMISRRLSVGET